ncbi:hypothetical protein HOO65_040056 [Ceratocystis lukuohia]|uniref:Uncharacterized protein n=1 Tax=Ceratocystis lukuohia TaxID=2019550 RepID=A0ABR4MHN1_9PEZI
MRFSSLASWCLSIPGLRNWVPSSSISDQPADPSYLNYHGYYVQYQHRTGQSAVYSDHPNPSAGFLAFSMHIDEARMVTTFYNNVLDQEISDDRSLELPQIYQAVCYQREVNFRDMKWVVMDVDDVSTLQIVQDYRKSHKLKRKDAIKVTPDDDEWALFSETRYYKDAARMNPDSSIDRILVQRQDRQTRNGEFPVVIAEVLMFSFKKPQENEEVFIDIID